jgi:hypothetical protein
MSQGKADQPTAGEDAAKKCCRSTSPFRALALHRRTRHKKNTTVSLNLALRQSDNIETTDYRLQTTGHRIVLRRGTKPVVRSLWSVAFS